MSNVRVVVRAPQAAALQCPASNVHSPKVVSKQRAAYVQDPVPTITTDAEQLSSSSITSPLTSDLGPEYDKVSARSFRGQAAVG